MAEVALVLLAAGGSTRMGTAKQLLPVDGVPMLRRAVLQALDSKCRPVLVVVGAAAQPVQASIRDLPVQVIENHRWREGQGTSVRAGVRALLDGDAEAAILALCDQPLLGPETYDRLVRTWENRRHAVVASEYAGTIGAPALFDRSLFLRLVTLPPDAGCKQLILELPRKLVASCNCPRAAIDIDTPAEYGRLGELARTDLRP